MLTIKHRYPLLLDSTLYNQQISYVYHYQKLEQASFMLKGIVLHLKGSAFPFTSGASIILGLIVKTSPSFGGTAAHTQK
jgi:hypothetical protein